MTTSLPLEASTSPPGFASSTPPPVARCQPASAPACGAFQGSRGRTALRENQSMVATDDGPPCGSLLAGAESTWRHARHGAVAGMLLSIGQLLAQSSSPRPKSGYVVRCLHSGISLAVQVVTSLRLPHTPSAELHNLFPFNHHHPPPPPAPACPHLPSPPSSPSSPPPSARLAQGSTHVLQSTSPRWTRQVQLQPNTSSSCTCRTHREVWHSLIRDYQFADPLLRSVVSPSPYYRVYS